MEPSQERRAGIAATPWGQLTARQREIVRWAAQGLSNKQIGQRLGISPETVKTHLHHVFDREGISGRIAVLAAYRRATGGRRRERSEEHTSELQSLMRISYAVFCCKQQNKIA